MIILLQAVIAGNANNVFIAIGGISTAVATYFLADTHKMLKRALAELQQVKIEQREDRVRIQDLEERLRAFRA
jgi:hypothetical protein